MAIYNYHLFSVIGLEIEYMLVDKTSLNIQPCSDLILKILANDPQDIQNEIALGAIAVSNELVLHVLELKHNGPKALPNIDLAHDFQTAIQQLQPILSDHNLMLLPTGAHPWMNPHNETKRWPHGNQEIYQQYDAIFNCKGHGWSNLQSMHINLPFANDQEFFQLHNAIRLLLPLIPALAASTPFLDSCATGVRDRRLEYYGMNQQRISAITGLVIPEFIDSPLQYQQTILTTMYNAIAPYDPENLLQYEWLNSRGVIPKFAYGALEIRIIDTQECIKADIAIANFIVAILQNWLMHYDYHRQNPCPIAPLYQLYQTSIQHGLDACIEDTELNKQWHINPSIKTAKDALIALFITVESMLDHNSKTVIQYILEKGNLSDRLLAVMGYTPNHAQLHYYYQILSSCLINNQQF